ncbi:hypothetical protein WN51_14490 [Melipona quadrifasciata]|uniref:Uncharacterized protein n=1 Tax=Melipona quadrifasciata TaxID=166423 RepID=A0A0N1ITH5_9HYME|nr:hypothetical protein WN51_14490 [Melipona quadrifasciata]
MLMICCMCKMRLFLRTLSQHWDLTSGSNSSAASVTGSKNRARHFSQPLGHGDVTLRRPTKILRHMIAPIEISDICLEAFFLPFLAYELRHKIRGTAKFPGNNFLERISADKEIAPCVPLCLGIEGRVGLLTRSRLAKDNVAGQLQRQIKYKSAIAQTEEQQEEGENGEKDEGDEPFRESNHALVCIGKLVDAASFSRDRDGRRKWKMEKAADTLALSQSEHTLWIFQGSLRKLLSLPDTLWAPSGNPEERAECAQKGKATLVSNTVVLHVPPNELIPLATILRRISGRSRTAARDSTKLQLPSVLRMTSARLFLVERCLVSLEERVSLEDRTTTSVALALREDQARGGGCRFECPLCKKRSRRSSNSFCQDWTLGLDVVINIAYVQYSRDGSLNDVIVSVFIESLSNSGQSKLLRTLAQEGSLLRAPSTSANLKMAEMTRIRSALSNDLASYHIRVDYPNFLNTSLETRLHLATRILRDIKADYNISA